MASENSVKMTMLLILFITFLFVRPITNMLGSSLDTLPFRFAAVLVILGAISYDNAIALGCFLIVCAIYIQHHHGEVSKLTGTANNISAYNSNGINAKLSDALDKLDHGGNADESYDSSDFTAKTEDQDNEFKQVDSSIDEKHVLTTEQLGSRAQSLFPDDSKHVNAMEQGNKNGYFD